MNNTLQRSHDLFDVIPVALAQLDLRMHFVRVNAPFAGLTGHHPRAHIGHGLREIAPALATQLEPICSKVLASGEVGSVEVQPAGRRADDTDQRLLAHCYPLKSAGGIVEGARVVLESIAHRTPVAHVALDPQGGDREKAEVLNRAILNSLRDHVAVIDGAGAVVAVNEAWNRFALENGGNRTPFGVESNYLDVCRRAAESSDTIAARALKGIESVLDGSSKQFHMEYPCDSPDQQRYFAMRVVPLQRREGGAVITHTDITERKTAEHSLREREQQLRLVIDSLPMLVAYVDVQQRYRIHNLPYCQFFGLSPEEITGHTVKEVFGEARYAEVRGHVRKTLGGAKAEFETAIPDASGRMRQIHGLYVPHLDESGKAHGYFTLIQDITDRLRAEDENRRHREELVHMDRVSMLAGLSASLAHELNQPLTAILNNAQAAQRLLAREPPDIEEVVDALGDIVADDKRAGEVIRRLRLLLGKSEPQVAPVQVNTVVRDVASLINSDALRRRISVGIDLSDDPPSVLGDRIQLQQVLLNLALNAFDAISKSADSPRVVVLGAAAREPDKVLMWVRDSGIGAGDTVLHRLFEPFFTTKNDGLGMGLAISKSIIESHGGRMWATRNEDRGLTVYCSLPLQMTDHD